MTGPGPRRRRRRRQAYAKAGFDEVYISQVGPGQEGFFEFLRQAGAAETARRMTGAGANSDVEPAFAGPTSLLDELLNHLFGWCLA